MHNLEPEPTGLLSVPEAAERLRISRRRVVQLAAAGTLAARHKMPGQTGAYLFSEDEVERYQRERDEAAEASA